MKIMKIKIALVSLLTFYCFSAMIAPQQKMYTEGYQVGDEASGFSLKNASNTVNGIGENVGFNDYKNGKGYIIIFTCNHCPFAKAYEDRINALHKVYAPKGFPVIAINSNDTESVPEDSYANMKIRAKEKFGFGLTPTGVIRPFNALADYQYDLGLDDHKKFHVNQKPETQL